MRYGKTQCTLCHKIYTREIRRINEAKKLNYKPFCSPICQNRFKFLGKYYTCNNQYCQNTFLRSPGSVSSHNFCSHSCAATYSNTRRRKSGPKVKKSLEENRISRIQGSKKGGINRWAKYVSIYTSEFIITKIQEFVTINNRLPVKREINYLYHPARKHFGTWNKTIEAAGFKPNPVLFAEHHQAKDGHTCDSLAEKLIDDYLTDHKIEHQRNVHYPEGRYTADFKIKSFFIEYFGLTGQLERYDKLKEIKTQLAKKYHLELITLSPHDLYPKLKLDTIFAKIL